MRAMFLALFLVSTPVSAFVEAKNADGDKAAWDEMRQAYPNMRRELYNVYMLWVEGQYHLGMCRPYIEESDFLSLRMWFNPSRTKIDPDLQRLTDIGDKQFYEGIQDSLKKPLGISRCKPLFSEWNAEFAEANKALTASLGQPD